MRRIKNDGYGVVDCQTFLSLTDVEFKPELNAKHSAFAWIDPKVLVRTGTSPELDEQEILIAIDQRLDAMMEASR